MPDPADRVYVKPAEGLKVRHPDARRHLHAAGEAVPRTSYWLRRLADGDVSEVPPPVAVAPSVPASAGLSRSGGTPTGSRKD